MASAVCTTCAAVRTFPSGEISTPEPSPATLTGCAAGDLGRSVSRVWISTTAPFTCANTADRVRASAPWACGPARIQGTKRRAAARRVMVNTSRMAAWMMIGRSSYSKELSRVKGRPPAPAAGSLRARFGVGSSRQ